MKKVPLNAIIVIFKAHDLQAFILKAGVATPRFFADRVIFD